MRRIHRSELDEVCRKRLWVLTNHSLALSNTAGTRKVTRTTRSTSLASETSEAAHLGQILVSLVNLVIFLVPLLSAALSVPVRPLLL